MSNISTLPALIKGQDIKLVVSGERAAEITKALEQRAKMLGKVRGYEFKGSGDYRGGRSKFVQPIYDLPEIARVIDVEPYVAQSIRKHREQILKEGFEIRGTDEAMVAYVKRRLFEIALLSGISTDQWLRELVMNVVGYHNGFLVFRRDASRASGKPITMYGKQIDPICGIFVCDPTSMEVSVDKWGTVRKWRQKLTGEMSEATGQRDFATEDVLHIPVDRKTGFTFGTPYVLPVLDDIRALRKIEEIAVIVSSKEAFPLYHYKVGTPERPAITYEGGGDEISSVDSQVRGLPQQGYVVTSERHEITLISRAGAALDLKPYLEYFEARMMSGLRLSPLDLGRGSTANRSTAGNLSKNLQDSAKDYQQVISDFLSFYLVIPLLLEGGFDITPDNLVLFGFPGIDTEEVRANQNHGLQLFMGDAITCEEYRKNYLNKEALTPEQENCTPSALQRQHELELARMSAAAKAASSSGKSKDRLRPVKKQVGSRARPSNQHGKLPTKSRFTANDYKSEVERPFSLFKSKILDSVKLRAELSREDIDSLIRDFVKDSVDSGREFITTQIEDGFTKAEQEYLLLHPDGDCDVQKIGARSIDRFFLNFMTKSFWKVINPYKDSIYTCLKKDIDDNIDVTRVVSVIETIRSAVHSLIIDQVITSERFGFIKFAKKIGRKTIDLVDPDTGTSTKIDITDIIYKSFIPNTDTIDHYLTLKG